MLNDLIKNQIQVNINNPVSADKFHLLTFNGTADGTLLTRLYPSGLLKNAFVRIISVQFAFYTDNSVWMREAAEDNKTFTANANSRYSMLQPYTRISPFYLEKMVSTNRLEILQDSNNLPSFDGTYFALFDTLNLNLLTEKINDGIDVKLNVTMRSDTESDTTGTPLVTVLMPVEIIYNLEPKKITL